VATWAAFCDFHPQKPLLDFDEILHTKPSNPLVRKPEGPAEIEACMEMGGPY